VFPALTWLQCLARRHSSNGPGNERQTHTHVVKLKRNRTECTSRNTEHGWRTHTWNNNHFDRLSYLFMCLFIYFIMYSMYSSYKYSYILQGTLHLIHNTSTSTHLKKEKNIKGGAKKTNTKKKCTNRHLDQSVYKHTHTPLQNKMNESEVHCGSVFGSGASGYLITVHHVYAFLM